MTANVAFITHSQYPFEPRARRMAEALAASGHEVDMFCLRHPGEPGQESLNGVTIYRLPVARRQGSGGLNYVLEYLRFFLAAAWQLNRRHVRKPYALIQVYNPPDILAFATLLPRLLSRTRVVLDVRDMAPELFMSRFDIGRDHLVTRTLRAHERWAAAYADAVTVCTVHQFEVMASRGIPKASMKIVMNCPDEAVFRTPAAQVSKHDGFSLVYHGGILRRYGLDVLVDAIPHLRPEIPGLRVDIYGTGDFLSAVRQLAESLGVADIVCFHGHLPLEVMPAAVKAADLGIVPMRRDVFTDTILPTKLMEYVYLGVPAVVARTATISEYFSDDMVAYFEAGDACDLARQVLTLYLDPDRRREMVGRAQAFTSEHNWSHEKAGYVALIERLVGGETA